MNPRIRRPQAVPPRSITMVISGAVFVALLALMLFKPVPYVVQGPGPTIDTLGEYQDTPLISIDDSSAYPTQDDDSQLRLTTVVASGGPGYPVRAADVLRGWVSGQSTVLPREALYAPEQSQQDVTDQGQAQMSRSQEDAAVVALTELGYDVPAELTITAAVPDTGAAGLVEDGDVIAAITAPDHSRTEVRTYADLAEVLLDTDPGTTVTLTVDRDGTETPVEIVTVDDGTGAAALGVYLAPEFDMPLQVDFDVHDVGGPSAGSMFALGIIDRLTEDDLTGGHIVAGTGTIALNGQIGPIGGIAQKMWGAKRDGAEYFLAPESNCDEVAGHEPDGLTVIAVDTLSDATEAVERIAADDTQDLPSC